MLIGECLRERLHVYEATLFPRVLTGSQLVVSMANLTKSFDLVIVSKFDLTLTVSGKFSELFIYLKFSTKKIDQLFLVATLDHLLKMIHFRPRCKVYLNSRPL